MKTTSTVSALEALRRLKDGNERFSQNIMSLSSLSHHERREKLQGSQNPFAIILSCSDSRVPSEIVFDQGLGDLFIIRVAGNIVAPSIVGSIEFAASTFGTELVVVMGHSNCGAVNAALDVEHKVKTVASENIRDIIDRITPAIRPLISLEQKTKSAMSRDELLDQCIKANVTSSVNQLKHGSRVIEDLVINKKLMVVGAEYILKSGKVEFWDSHMQSSTESAKAFQFQRDESSKRERVNYDQ